MFSKKETPGSMVPIKQVVADGVIVADAAIRVWPNSTFVLKTKEGEITFKNTSIEGDVAHCEILEGHEIVLARRGAA
jgi:hypothetical protein